MTDLEKSATNRNKELTKTQLRFLEYLKEFGWGKLEIVVRGGEPVLAKIIEKTERFDTEP